MINFDIYNLSITKQSHKTIVKTQQQPTLEDMQIYYSKQKSYVIEGCKQKIGFDMKGFDMISLLLVIGIIVINMILLLDIVIIVIGMI